MVPWHRFTPLSNFVYKWKIFFLVSSVGVSPCGAESGTNKLATQRFLLRPFNGEDNSAPTQSWIPPNKDGTGVGVQIPTRTRFFDFRYFPFLVRRPIPDCVHDARCLSVTQCASLGGVAKGKCHKGFAVCCALEAKCGSTIRSNETYLVNENYPSPDSKLGNCQYTIEKMNRNVCQLRLDMEALVLLGPDADSRCHQDTFSVSSGTGTTSLLLCGTNSGQHAYVDMAEGTTSARINIATATTGAERSWRIKVTQIGCNSRHKGKSMLLEVFRCLLGPNATESGSLDVAEGLTCAKVSGTVPGTVTLDGEATAPESCLQYFTDYSGIIKSFNYQEIEGVHQLAGHLYTVCVQAKPGFCGITFSSEDFSLSNDGSSSATSNQQPLLGDSDCNADFVSIFTASKEGIVYPDRYCGNRFVNVTTFSKPFEVRVVTDNNEDNGGEQNNRGFLLNYVQIPC